MSMEIKKVAVLGTGVMGSQIAAHLTNAGIKAFQIAKASSMVSGDDLPFADVPAVSYTHLTLPTIYSV